MGLETAQKNQNFIKNYFFILYPALDIFLYL